MPKPRIKASDLVHDISNGLDDDGLMKKYELSSAQLATVFTRLVEAKRVTQAELDTRGLILDDQPVKETKSSPIRIPVFIATCLLCLFFFGWPFFLKQQLLLHADPWDFYKLGPGFWVFPDQSDRPWHVDFGLLFKYIFTLVALAALTVVPPILVWIWTPIFSIGQVIRKSVYRFVKYKQFIAGK